MKKAGKYLVPALSVAAGLFFFVYCHIHYKFYSPTQGPMPGFMPEVLGALLALSGSVALIKARHEPDKELKPGNFPIVFAMFLLLIGNYLIGTLLSTGLFLFIWLKFISKYDWKTAVLVFLILMGFVFGVFKIWMDIPFENGIILEALLGL